MSPVDFFNSRRTGQSPACLRPTPPQAATSLRQLRPVADTHARFRDQSSNFGRLLAPQPHGKLQSKNFFYLAHGQSPGWQANRTSLSQGGYPPRVVQRRCLNGNPDLSRTQFRGRPETVRLHRGFGVHLHPGLLFAFIPEQRSESSRNPVHVPPDSPFTKSQLKIRRMNWVGIGVRKDGRRRVCDFPRRP
jgi:hypothetical protein